MAVYLCRTTWRLRSTISDPSSVGLVYEVPGAMTPAQLGDNVLANWSVAGTGATNSPEHYLSSEVDDSAGQVSVAVYDITGHLNGSPHGSPVHVSTGTRADGPPAGNNLPTGCAAVVSFRADYGTDVEFGTGTRPRARDRNRFYWGPLSQVATTLEGTTNRPMFSDAFIADMLKWITTKAVVLTVSAEFADLRIWSRSNASVKNPLTSWMDNRIDYQRRRADQGITRTTTPFP